MNTPQAYSSPSLGAVAYDVRTSFNPLSKDFMIDFQVSSARDGYAVVSFAIPDGMTRVFIAMLESMAGLFKFMERKIQVKQAEQKTIDPDLKHKHDEAIKKSRDKFTELCCKLFDGFIAQGETPVRSVQLTNSALRAKEHPWASTDVVRKTIASTGRLRKNWVVGKAEQQKRRAISAE